MPLVGSARQLSAMTVSAGIVRSLAAPGRLTDAIFRCGGRLRHDQALTS
jgi:hypothetical protein